MPEAIVPQNRLRAKLAEGRTVVGTMLVEIRQPSVMDLLANAGLDFVLIDSEHGPFSIGTIADLSRAGRSAGVTPIVRIPELTYSHITQPLDAGAQGIMLPRVTGPEQIAFCLECMKYMPQGRRGVVLARGHTGFRAGPLTETLAAMNRETFLVVQIETAEAVSRLEELLAVPGVDAALVGPTDLSVALGVPGQMDHPTLVAAIERAVAACEAHGVVPAIHTNDVTMSAAWARRGMRMVSNNSEAGSLMAGVRQAVGAIRG
ncbi:MAG TPA: aldolase/citrate lyase family protein [Gemmatimonadales bacterium]|nr:aldolase/citrate lyase family protein [Gemmatimonadales bacterium]